MSISDEELFKSANSYRLHQDVLRWTLLAGYAAFLVGILSIEDAKLLSPARTVLVVIGVCYMFILGVENFFYNLFAEYVKDCEATRDTHEQLRTMREFSRAEARRNKNRALYRELAKLHTDPTLLASSSLSIHSIAPSKDL